MKRKICVVTGTRAEYGLLYWLVKEIQKDQDFELQIIATGMHLSPEFGNTYRSIEADGLNIDEKVEMLLSGDSAVSITKSMGLGLIGFADSFNRLSPDLVILLGDRFEIQTVAQAAMIARIPIAHIAGGDTTEGAVDESIRHTITKMSHLHFVTNEMAYQRVCRMGENPEHVFNVGSPGIDQIKRLTLLSRDEFEKSIEFKLRKKNILVTFHPATLEIQSAREQFQELLDAFDELGQYVGIIFTKPNADTDGRDIIQMIDEYVYKHENAIAHTSLGQLRYLSAILHTDVVVGNSSSGLYEVPSFKKPTVNIGDRQKGRLQATSVINCKTQKDDILVSILKAFDADCFNAINPYGDGNSSQKIINILKSIEDFKSLLQKHFFM